jgi:thioesterase domain-containing protein
MALDYLNALRAVQPRGPYFLGGWSLGGLIAFEMARRLEEFGEEVALLAMLDTRLPLPDQPSPEEPEVIAAIIGEQNLTMPYADFKQLSSDERLRIALEFAWRMNVLPPGTGLQQMRNYVAVWKANLGAELRYAPRPRSYAGRLAFFRAEIQGEPPTEAAAQIERSDPARGWSQFCTQPPIIQTVPGTHLTIVEEPNVPALAESLKSCLEAVRA